LFLFYTAMMISKNDFHKYMKIYFGHFYKTLNFSLRLLALRE